MLAGSTSEEPLPADTEARLADFTELVGIAIAGAQARAELRGYAEEQAALRRVATLVAGGTPPEGVFGAVAGEAGRLLGVDLTGVARYETAGMATSVGLWTKTGTSRGVTVGDELAERDAVADFRVILGHRAHPLVGEELDRRQTGDDSSPRSPRSPHEKSGKLLDEATAG